MTASLRGRPLHGQAMNVPSGYTGICQYRIGRKKKAYLIAPAHNIFLLSPRKHVVDTHYKRLREALQTSNEISFK